MSTSVLERPDIEVVDQTEKGPRCQVSHSDCTTIPVAMGERTCEVGKPMKYVCQGVLDTYAFGVQVRAKCGDCLRPVEDCWVLEPL